MLGTHASIGTLALAQPLYYYRGCQGLETDLATKPPKVYAPLLVERTLVALNLAGR
jgi:hypothetical protein